MVVLVIVFLISSDLYFYLAFHKWYEGYRNSGFALKIRIF